MPIYTSYDSLNQLDNAKGVESVDINITFLLTGNDNNVNDVKSAYGQRGLLIIVKC